MAKIELRAWGVRQLIRHGSPDLSLAFCGGIGDDLLCSAAVHEHLARGARRLWFITRHPGLYRFDQRVHLLPDDARYAALSAFLKRPVRHLSYSKYEPSTDQDTALNEHIIIDMCRRAGLTGLIKLRPYLTLTPSELTTANEWAGCIALQTSSLNAIVPMENKQWPIERFQTVADHCTARGFRCIQVGSSSDPALQGVIDLRGKTHLRQTAAVLAQARLFVGLVGFLMHLARAVECPSVIVYGGREPPELTGYPCNENVVSRPPCSPCWQRNRCAHSHLCTESIDVAQVIASTELMLTRQRGPLLVAEASL